MYVIMAETLLGEKNTLSCVVLMSL